MKYLFVILTFLFLSTGIYAQKNVVFYRGAGKSDCNGNTDLCYSWVAGNGNDMQLYSEAKKDLTCKYEIASSTYKAKVSCMVIISSTYNYNDKCKRTGYGVGFGINITAATDDAIKHLQNSHWDWSPGKQGFKIEETKKFD